MNQIISYTPCLYNGMYPRCPKAKGVCPLEGIAKQVTDMSELVKMCITYSVME